MCHCATQASMESVVYWWDDAAWTWRQVENHPTPNRFAFVDDKTWIRNFAEEMGWLTD